ncbi:uncharacterized protein LOC110040941 [Orbicella faveolata]|uniref:uncharacterized protein LOC110040941 n=1 Tax=Orbicella faveolata TaxID=48498 RepID=UPI0009E6510C|nr:uncharacterized protein LOC110040941 [Orbicella faveolata]
METVVNLACLFLLSHLSIAAANLELISSDKTPCKKSAVNYNVTLSKGAKAGKYYKMAGINKMDECLGHCCGSRRCDVAFMVNKNCYLVKCFNSDSCALKQSDNPKFDTMLSVVSKPKAKTTKGEGKGEPAIEENLQEKASGTETTEPFIVDNGEDDMTTVTAFGTGNTKRTKRSSDVIDMVVAIGCGTVAVAVGVAGVIVMTRRLIDNNKS